MAYIYLLISVAMATVYALCYKVAAHFKCEMRTVNMWLEIGMILFLLPYLIASGFAYNKTALSMGLCTGLGTYIAIMAFFYHIRSAKLSVSWTVIGLSLAIPVLASIILWHEHPTLKQWAGLALIPVSFILFGMSGKSEGKAG